MLYITNKDNYAFVTKLDLADKLINCKLHESEKVMYQFKAEKDEINFDEVNGCAIEVKIDGINWTNGYFYAYENNNAANYINNFEM